MTETYYSILGVLRQFLENAAGKPFSADAVTRLNNARLAMQTVTVHLSNAIAAFHNAMGVKYEGRDSISERIIDAINDLEDALVQDREYIVDPSLAAALLCVREKLKGNACDIGGGNDPEPGFKTEQAG